MILASAPIPGPGSDHPWSCGQNKELAPDHGNVRMRNNTGHFILGKAQTYIAGMYDLDACNRKLTGIIVELNHQCGKFSKWLRLYGRYNQCIHCQF